MSMTLSLPASSLPYVANNLLEEILLLCGQGVSYGGCGLLVLCDDPGDLFQPLWFYQWNCTLQVLQCLNGLMWRATWMQSGGILKMFCFGAAVHWTATIDVVCAFLYAAHSQSPSQHLKNYHTVLWTCGILLCLVVHVQFWMFYLRSFQRPWGRK